MGQFTVCSLLAVLQLAFTARTRLDLQLEDAEGTSRSGTGKCMCAVCKKPDSIRLGPVGASQDKDFCHWSKTHKYFWCRVQHGCPCARSWARCGEGTAHYDQLLHKVINAPPRADPCMFKDFDDFGSDFLSMVESDKEKQKSTLPGYVAELDKMSLLVQACEMREPYSRAIQLAAREATILSKINAFLEKPQLTSHAKLFGLELCQKVMSKYYEEKTGGWNFLYAHDPCNLRSSSAEAHQMQQENQSKDLSQEFVFANEIESVCSSRFAALDKLAEQFRDHHPSQQLFNSMTSGLSPSQKMMVNNYALKDRTTESVFHKYHLWYGCTYALNKAEQWNRNLATKWGFKP